MRCSRMEYFNILKLIIQLSTVFWLKNVEARFIEEGIIGGQVANENEIKYIVSVQANNQPVCGGVIFDDYFILTAAHCIIGYDNKFINMEFSILAGVTNAMDSNGMRVKVEKAYVPKEFGFTRDDPESTTVTFNLSGDIAVLKLHEPLGLDKPTSKLTKLEVPKIDITYPMYENEEVVVVGFGCENIQIEIDPETNEEREVAMVNDGRLKYAETMVIPNDVCMRDFQMPIDKSHICAQVKQRGNGHHDSVCLGDSGGPLVHGGNKVIGILSAGPVGCQEQDDAGVYTRVTSYAAFIQFAKSDVVTPTMRSVTYYIEKE